MPNQVDERVDLLAQGPRTKGIADCMRYVAATFDNALLVAQQMNLESRTNPEDPGMPVNDSLVVAIYDRLNAEMMLRGVDAPNMPPRGGEDGRIEL